MVWAAGAILTVLVVIFVGYPLFVRENEAPAEDALEAAISQRRSRARSAGGVATPPASEPATRRGAQKCGKCGALNLAEDRFCARCGGQLGQACAKCGAEYKAGDIFCARCGARLAGR